MAMGGMPMRVIISCCINCSGLSWCLQSAGGSKGPASGLAGLTPVNNRVALAHSAASSLKFVGSKGAGKPDKALCKKEEMLVGGRS